MLRLGAAYELISVNKSADTGLPLISGLLVLEYQNVLNSDENTWEWGAGAELTLFGIVAGRIGYHERNPKTNDTLIRRTLETGMTYGFGVHVPVSRIFKTAPPVDLVFDLASAPQNGFVEDYEMFTVALLWAI